MLVQACLNGSRSAAEHGAVPLTPDQLAQGAVAARRAGAATIHVHPRHRAGYESLRPDDVAAVCVAVRDASPGLPVGVTTAARIVPDLERRIATIRSWTVLPDFASVNLSEQGAVDVIDVLTALGIGVEGCIWSVGDARLLIAQGLDSACMRVLVEVESELDPVAAVTLASAIDVVLDEGRVQAPRLHHGTGAATWHVIDAGISRGHDVRIGLEDTLVFDDGTQAPDNAALVAAVLTRARAAGRTLESTTPQGPVTE